MNYSSTSTKRASGPVVLCCLVLWGVIVGFSPNYHNIDDCQMDGGERNNFLHFYQKIVVHTFLDPSLSCNGWQTARGWNVFVFPELHSVHIAACFLRSSNSFEAHPVFSQLEKFIHFNCSWILNCFLSSRKYNVGRNPFDLKLNSGNENQICDHFQNVFSQMFQFSL